MESAFSSDDLEAMWTAAPAGTSTGISRISSEWMFEKFFLEASSSSPASSTSCPVPAVSHCPAASAEFTDPPAAPAPSSSSQSRSRGEDDEVVVIKGRSSPSDQPPANPADHQVFLRKRLDLACAAVALSRVVFSCYIIECVAKVMFVSMEKFQVRVSPEMKLGNLWPTKFRIS